MARVWGEMALLGAIPAPRGPRLLADSAEKLPDICSDGAGFGSSGARLRQPAEDHPTHAGLAVRRRGAGLVRSPGVLKLGAVREIGGHSGLSVGDELAGEVVIVHCLLRFRRRGARYQPAVPSIAHQLVAVSQPADTLPVCLPTRAIRQATPPASEQGNAEAGAVSQLLGAGTISRCREDRNTAAVRLTATCRPGDAEGIAKSCVGQRFGICPDGRFRRLY